MTRRYLIHGRVHGVGFRYFVLRMAEAFDINGYVRNTDDGAVEVVASGTRENLQSFREQIEIGPSASRVDAVAAEDLDDRRFDDFRIAH